MTIFNANFLLSRSTCPARRPDVILWHSRRPNKSLELSRNVFFRLVYDERCCRRLADNVLVAMNAPPLRSNRLGKFMLHARSIVHVVCNELGIEFNSFLAVPAQSVNYQQSTKVLGSTSYLGFWLSSYLFWRRIQSLWLVNSPRANQLNDNISVPMFETERKFIEQYNFLSIDSLTDFNL